MSAPVTNCPTRWMVEGILTTSTPLHIGDGDVTHHPEIGRADKDSGKPSETDRADVNRVVRDTNDRPYVPATALRSALRRAFEGTKTASEVDDLLGSQEQGSCIEVWDSNVVDPQSTPEHTPSYWRADRLTGIAAHVAIDRKTRTAAPERLYYEEFVPAGMAFAVRIHGTTNEAEEDRLREILAALACLGEGRVRIGANAHAGWGAFTWSLTSVRRMGPPEVRAWIADPNREVASLALPVIPTAEFQAMGSAAMVRGKQLDRDGRRTLTLELELHFDAHFLVNDNSRTGDEPKPSHAPMLDANGRPYLPSDSFHGALRAQAERIVRTVHGEHACCGAGTAKPSCPDLQDVKALGTNKGPCLVCSLFGAAGWATAVDCSDFTSAAPATILRQDFVALDRFTGGVSGSKKFSADAAYKPTLSGRMDFDLDRLAQARCLEPALGLTALLLRDLVEGDITFGFGAAKGYGACRARIVGMKLPAGAKPLASARSGLPADIPVADLNGLFDSRRPAIDQWISAFEQSATTATR